MPRPYSKRALAQLVVDGHDTASAANYPNGPMFYNPTAGRVYFVTGDGEFSSYEV